MSSNPSDDESHDTIDSWTTHKLHQTHFNDGYREGIDHGRESALQEGFDSGYLRGFESAFRRSTVRGMLSGLAMQTFNNQSTREALLELIQKIENCKKPSVES